MSTKPTAYETLLVADDAGVRTVTLNRPDDLNAVDDRVTAELQKALRDAARDRAVRCLVLTGAGRAFCAGQDLKAVVQRSEPIDFAERLRQGYNPVIARLSELEIPTIACVNGVAAGAGWSLALACDLRICSSQAKFVAAFSKIGLIPDSGMTQTLARLVGPAKALEIAWFSETIAADEALRLGLVNRVVEPGDLHEAARTWARALAPGATRGIALTKRAIVSSFERDLAGQLEYEAQLQGVAGNTQDYAEGVRAFIEKRPAEFKGE